MNSCEILGVPFYTGSLESAVDLALFGGHVNAPSGPGMAWDLVRSYAYRCALSEADMNITDSGIMVLAWRLLHGRRVPRYSGLLFLKEVMKRPVFREPAAVFWVMPTRLESDRNTKWLNDHGFPVLPAQVYLAPRYGPGFIEDTELLALLEKERPKVVMMAIGGGNQERLAHYLRGRLSYRPTILCLGAAIAFITGGQAKIPNWADRLCLGWLLRVLYNPKVYLPRYWRALSIFFLIWKYGDRFPPLKVPAADSTVSGEARLQK